ncbi:MAG: hypothetical protein L0332_28725 [Chloroflexi bacterium]|nr:hypothetical protein [Chloroflexota bacterium]MCI0644103.1 hypothetical protein [Chloroflexota bacterium]MCI0730684.1 hypothetical protein [Chloroflexota bacterium]
MVQKNNGRRANRPARKNVRVFVPRRPLQERVQGQVAWNWEEIMRNTSAELRAPFW